MIKTDLPLPPSRDLDPVCSWGLSGKVIYAGSRELATYLGEAVNDKHTASFVVGVAVPTYMRWVKGISSPNTRNLRRLQTAARVTVWLQGSYNESGIASWWNRDRKQLDGLNPVSLVHSDKEDALARLEHLVFWP